MHIAVSGYSGCGNTTLSSLIAKKFDLKLVNYTFRDMAKDKGLDFEALRALAEKDSSYDIELDKKQVEMALSTKNSILASRLAIWMLKSADLKVFLDISLLERSRRVCQREGGTFEYWYEHTQKRDDADNLRYKKLYNIDNRDLKTNIGGNLLIIKDDKATASDMLDIITAEIKKRRLI